jgi:non-ribosomal peptide synthetase component F
VAVPGLVPDAVYFDHLVNRRFPAANFIRRANELDYSQKPDIFHDVFGPVSILSTVSFDAFLFELCLSTLSGARLILAPTEQTPGERLAAFATRSGVTHLNLPPAVLNMMSPDSLSTCPYLSVGGESPAPQEVEQWSKGRRMINNYGSTEVTVCATTSEPLSGTIVLPIGRPIWNTRVYVLDAGLEPVSLVSRASFT